MAYKTPHSVEFKAEVIRALLDNASSAMELAGRFGLSPGEIRDIIHETILHLDGTFSQEEHDLPITAHPPAELLRLTPTELKLLLGDYPEVTRNKSS